MRMGKRLYSLIMFLGVSVLGGLLTAGLIVPVAGIATASGASALQNLDQLPAALDAPEQPERSKLLNADGSVLGYFYAENRVYVTLDKISLVMQQAQVAIEDSRFYEHGALDLRGTLRALVSTSQGNTQGGSSLTQQYVRQVLVEKAEEDNDKDAIAAATENTLARKVRELRYAITVEQNLTKNQILEKYLNIVYYGDGAYGIESAAHHYFNVSAAKLNLAQAAMLAGLVRNPNATNPVANAQLAIARRNDVLNRMLSLGEITAQQADQAKAVTFNAKLVQPYRKGCANAEFPFVCDYAEQTLLQMDALGNTVAERLARLNRGGLTIQTQIDAKAQLSAEKVIGNYLKPRDPALATIVMVEPGTGQITTMAQSRPVMGANEKAGETYYNYNVSRAMDGAEGFQGGSTFKAFVTAAALQDGMGAYKTYHVNRRMDFTGKTYQSCSGPFKSSKWPVVGEAGTYNLFTGAAHSVNGYFAQLEQPILCDSVTIASKLGLEISMPVKNESLLDYYQYIPSFTLGVVEVTPLSLVNAYATFASGGIYCKPVILKSIKTSDGTSIPVPDAGCTRVLDQDVANGVNKILQGPFNYGTAAPAKVPGITMAGKTGTVSDNKAIWTIGYTPALAAGAVISWDSNPYYNSFWKHHKAAYLKGAYMKYSKHYIWGLSGREAGAKLLRPAFANAIAGIDPGSFVEPSSDIMRGKTVDVPSCDGLGLTTCRSRLEAAGFSTYVTRQYDDTSVAGDFLGTTETGTTTKYAMIGLIVSRGPKPQPKPSPTPTAPTTQPATPGKPHR